MSEGSPVDWLEVLERIEAGDRVAFARFNRLLSGFLAQLRAYDFRDEWDDLRQEVLMATLENARRGRLRDPRAFAGYVRVITRNKFVDRLKRELRTGEREALAWDDEAVRVASPDPPPDLAAARRRVRAELETLPEEQRRLIAGVYLEGHTYQEMSDATGVPLGTLKRRLREGLAALRGRLSDPGAGGGVAL